MSLTALLIVRPASCLTEQAHRLAASSSSDHFYPGLIVTDGVCVAARHTRLKYVPFDELIDPESMLTRIRFIQRDEVTHLLLFQNMTNATKKQRPDLFTKELTEDAYELFRDAVRLECEWGAYITQGQIHGLTDKTTDQYIQYLADKRLHAVGLEKLYNVEHPIKWVDNFSQFNDQKTNFFEGNVTNYSKGSLDLDDF